MDKKIIKVYTTSNGAELNISAPSIKQTIYATNNRAQYFAEQAKKYRDEAKYHRDNAQYYAEQNSDVTIEYVNNVKANLEEQIATKQIVGDYALKDELPKNVSELENDAQYVESSVLQTVVEDLKLPSEDGCSGCFLTTDGKNKSWAEIKALNKSQITNCLLEVPQNIKLELNDGVLTLKAGSKVIVPNGAGVFDEITIDIDKTDTAPVSFSLQCMVYLSNNKDLDVIAITTTYSGSTDAGNNSLWYDTTNNNVRRTSSSGVIQDGNSFPIAIVSMSDGVFTSIDQIFNGMGYIGSTIWVDKGVKGLIPNGRNEDGTLNNIEAQNNSLITITYTDDIKGVLFGFGYDGYLALNGAYSYDKKENYVYNGTNISPTCYCGTYDVIGGKVSNFNPKQPFRAVDYNDAVLKTDKQEIVSWLMPDYSAGIDISSQVLSGYTAPSDGFITYAYATASASTVTVNGNIVTQKIKTSGTYTISAQIFVKKGDVFKASLGDWNSYFFPLKGAN